MAFMAGLPRISPIHGVLTMKRLAVAACALLISGSVLAGEPEAMGHDMMDGEMMGAHRGPGDVCHIVGSGHHMAGTLAFLRAELKITPAQSAAFESFGEAFGAMRPSGGSHKMHGKPGAGGSMGMPAHPSLSERMDRQERMMEERVASMKTMHGVIRELYGKLGDAQKRMADELIPAFMMCRMRG
jgi:hypothetical protein